MTKKNNRKLNRLLRQLQIVEEADARVNEQRLDEIEDARELQRIRGAETRAARMKAAQDAADEAFVKEKPKKKKIRIKGGGHIMAERGRIDGFADVPLKRERKPAESKVEFYKNNLPPKRNKAIDRAESADPKRKPTLTPIRIYGERIRAHRLAHDVPAEELAHRAGITLQQWWLVERNKKPHAEACTIAAMCRAQGISLEYVMGLDERKPELFEARLNLSDWNVEEVSL